MARDADPGDGPAPTIGARATVEVRSRGTTIAAAVAVALFLPLIAHRSRTPVVLAYSATYAGLLAVVAGIGALVVILVRWRCRARGTDEPAIAFALVAGSAVFACLLMEMFLTFRLRGEDSFGEYSAWGHKRSILFGFEAAPGNHWAAAGATYSTDHLGFRTHVAGPWEDHRGPRVFTLGESSVFGFGLNDDQTWTHLLEAKLRARDPAIDVVNGGNNGHTSIQTLLRFYQRVLPLSPSHVLLYLGPNDFFGTGKDRVMITEDILFADSVAQYWSRKTEGQNPYARSLLFYAIARRIPWLARTAGTTPDTAASGVGDPRALAETELDEIGKRYAANVQTMCLVAKARGVTPVIVTFMHHLKGRLGRALDHDNDLLRDLARDQGVPLVDVAAVLAATRQAGRFFFEDHYHPNRDGAELIASVIAEKWSSLPIPMEPRS